MAIELYYTLASNKSPRRWRDAYVSCGGSMATWLCFMWYMERKYLPSLPPLYPTDRNRDYNSRWSRTVCLKDGEEHPMQEVWDLQLSSKTTHAERLTMQSMMDKSYFYVVDFPKVAEAWLEVANMMKNDDTEKSFSALIKSIRQLIHITPGICSIAIHWNSVVSFYECNGKTDKDCYDFVADNNKGEENFNPK